MRMPLDNNPRVSTEYMAPATGSFGKHLGLDFAVGVGTPVYAPGSGVVSDVSTGPSGGKTIAIDIGGYTWRFLHLNDQLVKKGQAVTEGQLIAKTGKTGVVTGPHLHTDVRVKGTAWNASLSNYRNPRTVVEEGNRAPQQSGNQSWVGKRVYLSKTVDKWAFYRPGAALPVKRANRAGELAPKKWGGLNYRIDRVVALNTVEVTSPSLGKIWLYVDQDATVK